MIVEVTRDTGKKETKQLPDRHKYNKQQGPQSIELIMFSLRSLRILEKACAAIYSLLQFPWIYDNVFDGFFAGSECIGIGDMDHVISCLDQARI